MHIEKDQRKNSFPLFLNFFQNIMTIKEPINKKKKCNRKKVMKKRREKK